MIEKAFKPKPKKESETEKVNGWLVVEKDGTIRKAEKRNNLQKVAIEGGCSPENGIPVKPILNGKVRKRAKRT